MPPTHSLPWAVVQHVPYEGPGALARHARERGLELHPYSMYAGEKLPEAGEIGGLIVMGGPMGVYETGRYPHLRAEMNLIAAAAERELPMVGVCLGAQLMAEALGGRVYRGAVAEVGMGPVKLTEAGRKHAVFAGSADPMPVLHWHQDTFTLPPGAVLLASSPLYPHQAFQWGARSFGLQFHIEVDEGLALDWQPHLPEGVRLEEAEREAIAANGRQVLPRLFEHLLAER